MSFKPAAAPAAAAAAAAAAADASSHGAIWPHDVICVHATGCAWYAAAVCCFLIKKTMQEVIYQSVVRGQCFTCNVLF